MLRRGMVVSSVFLALVGSACARSEEEIWADFHDYLVGKRDCASDDECVPIWVDCPLGCMYGVNRKYESDVQHKARDLVEEFNENDRCFPRRCEMAPARGVCEEDRCAAVTIADGGVE